MDMMREWTLDTVVMRSFDSLFYSYACMDALVENVHRNPSLTQNPAKPVSHSTGIKIYDGIEKKKEELIFSLPLNAESSSRALNDSLMARYGPLFRSKKKMRKTSPR